MTGEAEILTGDPRWHNFLPGTSPLGFIFTGVEATGSLSRDVTGEGGDLEILIFARRH